MTVGPLNHLDPIPEPLGDDVDDAFPGGDQITCEAPSHVVDGAANATPPHMGLEGAGEVVAIPPRLLFLLRPQEVLLLSSTSSSGARNSWNGLESGIDLFSLSFNTNPDLGSF
jgi:hypothetical protein